MKPVTRFAPSPTGRLHLGHAMAAWVAHALARAHGGTFLLRHEDIDSTRVREGYYQGIEEDLLWLGFPWDGPALRQTSRVAAYEEALETLGKMGVTYPCFCTRREISEIAAPQGPEGPLYPGTCRNLSPALREEKLVSGISHSWRLDAAKAAALAGDLSFTDLLHGTITVDPLLLGDVVLGRKDVGIAYHLSVVVDDAFQHITHVTRGDDLLPSTHVHRMLQKLLELPEPIYLHHPLVTDTNGKRLAKRNDALSITKMRQDGAAKEAILAEIQDAAVIRAIASAMTSSSV